MSRSETQWDGGPDLGLGHEALREAGVWPTEAVPDSPGPPDPAPCPPLSPAHAPPWAPSHELQTPCIAAGTGPGPQKQAPPTGQAAHPWAPFIDSGGAVAASAGGHPEEAVGVMSTACVWVGVGWKHGCQIHDTTLCQI